MLMYTMNVWQRCCLATGIASGHGLADTSGLNMGCRATAHNDGVIVTMQSIALVAAHLNLVLNAL